MKKETFLTPTHGRIRRGRFDFQYDLCNWALPVAFEAHPGSFVFIQVFCFELFIMPRDDE